jgi:hypothetical protein
MPADLSGVPLHFIRWDGDARAALCVRADVYRKPEAF